MNHTTIKLALLLATFAAPALADTQQLTGEFVGHDRAAHRLGAFRTADGRTYSVAPPAAWGPELRRAPWSLGGSNRHLEWVLGRLAGECTLTAQVRPAAPGGPGELELVPVKVDSVKPFLGEVQYLGRSWSREIGRIHLTRTRDVALEGPAFHAVTRHPAGGLSSGDRLRVSGWLIESVHSGIPSRLVVVGVAATVRAPLARRHADPTEPSVPVLREGREVWIEAVRGRGVYAALATEHHPLDVDFFGATMSLEDLVYVLKSPARPAEQVPAASPPEPQRGLIDCVPSGEAPRGVMAPG